MRIHLSSLDRTTIPAQLVQLIIYFSLLLYLLTFTLPVFAEPEVVGHISFVRGSNAAQQPGAGPRMLGMGTEIYQGDNIQTTERSFVIIKFSDGSEITVRPNSNFSINHYDNHSDNKAIHLELFHGGIAASTGDITTSNPENFQIKTPATTIRPQSANAEFVVDVCDQNCEAKGKEAAANRVRTEQSVVARVVNIKGDVTAKNQTDKSALERRLSLNSPLFNSDAVITGYDSYALLVFPDGEKVTLEADTELDIMQYVYNVTGKNDKVSLRLVTGGLRALTGLIGKNNPSAVTIDTPVATIGIRGTHTNTYTDGTSTINETVTGTSFVRNETGEHDVPAGHSSHTAGSNVPPTIFVTPPDAPAPVTPSPADDDNDPDEVHQEEPPVEGDTAVRTIKGEVEIESNDGENDSSGGGTCP